ncbi:hypothetical protein [Spirosoma endophyticum]|uniref:DUF1871 domain-containing protein n=1 Tax=Spirosoma endophyticum TaxID=662367 RepID=A0A1I2I352_9BACT|nr:hypothetical protein [Spirosoma endophyticum]SFF35517.1 hypothetical protein SAMN05216167_1532 [Spirosoma endophyticum]
MIRLGELRNQIYESIDTLLWEEWDPIAINNIAPRDEYQSYTPQLYSLAINGAAIDEVADALLRIEQEKMGLDGDSQHCRAVAEKIVAVTKKLALG